MLGTLNLTVLFESWHIPDGNYPPLQKWQTVNLSFEMDPAEAQPAAPNQLDSFIHLGGGEYEFTGSIVRRYASDPQNIVIVVESGDFKFYINRSLPFDQGDRVKGRGTLLLDHYIWVEFLDNYPNPPDLFYQLLVKRIFRVQGSSKQAVEIEPMEGEDFDEAFCVVELTDAGVFADVPRTFRS